MASLSPHVAVQGHQLQSTPERNHHRQPAGTQRKLVLWCTSTNCFTDPTKPANLGLTHMEKPLSVELLDVAHSGHGAVLSSGHRMCTLSGKARVLSGPDPVRSNTDTHDEPRVPSQHRLHRPWCGEEARSPFLLLKHVEMDRPAAKVTCVNMKDIGGGVVLNRARR
jgi:hypothetical protein